jgi:hypothetical protein
MQRFFCIPPRLLGQDSVSIDKAQTMKPQPNFRTEQNSPTPARRQRVVRGLCALTLAALLLPSALRAQQDAQENRRVQGEVTAVNGATLTLKSEEGDVYTVVTTDNTRIMKGRGNTIKVADIKAGDGAMAMGNLDAPARTLHAAVLMDIDAAQIKAARENLGKTYIAGKVTAIDLDNAKMTVERPDHVSQTIGFDETTSFKRGRLGRGGMGMGMGAAAEAPPAAAGDESITLADIKVGDMVGGQGAVKGGTFIPRQLTVSTPGQGHRHAEGATPAAGPNPAAGAPTPAPGPQ